MRGLVRSVVAASVLSAGAALGQEIPQRVSAAASPDTPSSVAEASANDLPWPVTPGPSVPAALTPSPSEGAAAEPAALPSPAFESVQSGTWSMTLPLGLQASAANLPEDNPMSEEKIALGKLLFFDPRLSKDSTVSCASCHNPFHGFADPDRTSQGIGGQRGNRNSPTIINRLFSSDQFWDGRAESLEEQARAPITNPVEMGMPSSVAVVQRLKGIKGYAPLFAKAFGDESIDMDRVVKAIAAYERSVVTGNSPFDRFQAGDNGALNVSALRGMELFNGKANCKTCHAGFNFTDENYRNIGVGMDKNKPDLGRYLVTKKQEDIGKFKTPTLRNVALTAPYMHDGSEETLLDVIEFYDKGGVSNPRLDPDMKPLNLTEQEKRDLVAFLEALTGDVTNAVPPDTLPQ